METVICLVPNGSAGKGYGNESNNHLGVFGHILGGLGLMGWIGAGGRSCNCHVFLWLRNRGLKVVVAYWKVKTPCHAHNSLV